jgi:hypothetical protein
VTQNKINKKLSKKISDYVQKNKCKTQRKGDIIVNGKSTLEYAYTLPRTLLTLNVSNHRFTTAMNTLKDERLDMGKSADFDLNNKSDVEEIRNMLRGISPSNTYRKSQYDKLLQEVETYSLEHGNNGLKELTIVTSDGVYINGNRRDTVLEDLKNKQIKKKKGGLPQNYDCIDVIICPDSITYSDIRQMELKEQVGLSLRDEYDFMNTAMLVKEEYDNLLESKGSGKESEALNIIASRIEGKSIKNVKEYLEFLSFVDDVLEILHLEGDYHKINTKSDDDKDSNPVTTICREFQQKWSKASKTDKPILIFQCAAYCQGVFAKSKTGLSDYRYTSRNYRNLKTALTKKSGIFEMEKYDFSTHDFQSDVSSKKYGDTIQIIEEKAKNEDWLERPSKLLTSIEGSLFTIDSALSSSESKKVKTRLEQVKVERSLKQFKASIISIETKLKKMKN